jgi:hypothetical protein
MIAAVIGAAGVQGVLFPGGARTNLCDNAITPLGEGASRLEAEAGTTTRDQDRFRETICCVRRSICTGTS